MVKFYVGGKVGEHAVCPAGVPAGGHLPRHSQPKGHQGGSGLDTGTVPHRYAFYMICLLIDLFMFLLTFVQDKLEVDD